MRVRQNVYQLPAGDKTLFWYEKAVAEMKTRPATDVTSWNYQAAIHGIDVKSVFWKNVQPLPSTAARDQFWENCQHQSCFFLPWHRMYLGYFEQIVAQTIITLGGPAGWCLPFWDYTDSTNPNARVLPPPFLNPGNTANSLWMPDRNNKPIDSKYVVLDALNTIPYIGTDPTSSVTGFGGPQTPFFHFGSQNGALEELPHNQVHDQVGGAMADPNTAALDPIFWLHHANIDRLWQVWLNKGQRTNPTGSFWLNYTFQFHDNDSNVAEMKCADIVDTRNVLDGYTYQGVSPGLPAPQTIQTLAKMDFTMPLEVVAATNRRVALNSGTTTVILKLTPSKKKQTAFVAISEVLNNPKTTILKLENIRGKGVPPLQDIYLNVPESAGKKNSFYAGSISLFGLANSSTPGLHHDGSGQNYALDITDLMNKLRSLPNWNEKQLTVSIEPVRPMNNNASVSIGRISLYSE